MIFIDIYQGVKFPDVPAHVLELLVVVHALRVLCHYILGSGAQHPPGALANLTLRTDNQAVSRLSTKRDVNCFLARWLDEIKEFSFDAEHVPGRLNHADPSTRRSFPEPAEAAGSGSGPAAAADPLRVSAAAAVAGAGPAGAAGSGWRPAAARSGHVYAARRHPVQSNHGRCHGRPQPDAAAESRLGGHCTAP